MKKIYSENGFVLGDKLKANLYFKIKRNTFRKNN